MALEGGNAVKRTGMAGVIADARKKAYPDIYEAKKDKSVDVESAALAKYINENIDGGGSGAVDSVFGREGDVVAENGDYTTDQVTEGTNKYYPGEDADKLAGIEPGADVTDADNVYSAGAQMVDEKSEPNGYASLDGDGKVPESELPDSVLSTMQVVYNRSKEDATKIDVDGDGPVPDVTGFRLESTAAGDRGMKHITPAAYLTAARPMRFAQFGAYRHYLVENVLYTIVDTTIYRFYFPSMKLLDSHDIGGVSDISDISANLNYIFCLVGDNCLVLDTSDYSTFANFSVLSTGNKHCAADDDYVYVQDYSDTRFVVFTPGGSVVSSFTYGGSEIYNCLAVDSGYVYVCQGGTSIRKFNKTSPHTEVASATVSYAAICLCSYASKVYVVDAYFDIHILNSLLVEQLVFPSYTPAGGLIYDISASVLGLVLTNQNTTGFYSQPGLSALTEADYEWIHFTAASWSEAGMTGRVGPIDIENNANSIATIVASKGVADGYASLDGTGKVPSSQLPSGTVNSVFGRAGAVVAELGDYTTDQVTEGTSKYYPSADSSKLAGIEANADVTDATNVAGAGAQMTSEKSQANGYASLDGTGRVPTGELPASLVGSVSYQGVWNADTNVPVLASSTGTKGYYYVVSDAGSTNLDGITDWNANDWAIFNGSTWDKIDNTDGVSSVFGRSGAVVATSGDYTTDQVTEGTNKYYPSEDSSKLAGIESGAEVNTVDSVFGRGGVVVATSGDYTADQVNETTTRVFTSPAQESKLNGIEAGAEVNNISDTDATALTDGGETTLHTHPGGGGGVTAADPTVLQRVDTLVWENAQTGVQYFSPDQYGEIYGKVIRKFYSGTTSAATNTTTLEAGINPLKVINSGGYIDNGSGLLLSLGFSTDGSMVTTPVYARNADADLALGHIAMNSKAYECWVDFTLQTPPTTSPTGQPFADPLSPFMKRADSGVWELPQITKHGTITAISDAGGGDITVLSVNTLSAGDVVNITGTTSYDGLYIVNSATGANFTVTATFVSTETGRWVDTNEYLSKDAIFSFLGDTVFVRRIEDANLDTNTAYIEIPGASKLAVIKFDGYFIQTGDTDDRRGINSVVGTSTLQVQFFGHLGMLETYAASAITVVRGLLTYIKNADD